MNMAVHYMSERQDWSTPQPLFDALNAEFGFTLDPCALPSSAKCAKFYTPENDGLAQDWTPDRVFLNPPYGNPEHRCKANCKKKKCAKRGWHRVDYLPGIRDWMRKAYEHAQRGGVVVCLVPARTDTAWWHDYTKGAEIRFIRGRVKFGDGKQGAPFPSAIIVFGGST